MLALTRQPRMGRDKIFLTGGIEIKILKVKGKQVRVGISAPDGVRIARGEIGLESEGEDDN